MILRKAEDKVQIYGTRSYSRDNVDDVAKVCKNALIEKKENHNKKF